VRCKYACTNRRVLLVLSVAEIDFMCRDGDRKNANAGEDREKEDGLLSASSSSFVFIYVHVVITVPVVSLYVCRLYGGSDGLDKVKVDGEHA